MKEVILNNFNSLDGIHKIILKNKGEKVMFQEKVIQNFNSDKRFKFKLNPKIATKNLAKLQFIDNTIRCYFDSLIREDTMSRIFGNKIILDKDKVINKITKLKFLLLGMLDFEYLDFIIYVANSIHSNYEHISGICNEFLNPCEVLLKKANKAISTIQKLCHYSNKQITFLINKGQAFDNYLQSERIREIINSTSQNIEDIAE